MSSLPVHTAPSVKNNAERVVSVCALALLDADWTRAPNATIELDDDVVASLEQHGLSAAVGQRLRRTTLWSTLRASVRAALEQSTRQLAARELAGAAQLQEVDAAMAQAGIDVLVIKGEALAQHLYPRPAMRERMDIDLWVQATDFDRTTSVLTALGYTGQLAVGGEWLQPERSFVRTATLGPGPSLDLHRRLFSQALLARALSFDEVFAAGLPLSRMRMRAPSPAHALLIAALHRVAHTPMRRIG